MNILFYTVALCMCLVAASTVLRPLVLNSERRHQGYARSSLLAVVVVILFAVGLYAAIGRPGAAGSSSYPANSMSRPAASPQSEKIGSVTSLLTGLEERLANNPADGSGWLLLAKSYRHLARNDEALAAYDKAAALGYADVAFLESLADGAGKGSGTAEIRGRVTLSAAASGLVADSDTVFVIAKAASGSPIPLAVLRKPASTLPFDFVLNDSLSMVKGNPLSAADQVVVTVKISSSGDALQTNTELEASSAVIPTKDSPHVALHINPAAAVTGN